MYFSPYKMKTNPKKINPRSEIITMMRGFFSLPIITTLSNLGIIDILLKKKNVSIKDFKRIKNKEFLTSVFSYLESLGILNSQKKDKNKFFKVTILGDKILKRKGSFHLLNSYSPFINNLQNFLTKTNNRNISCNRTENVIGSGLTNGRKFFPKALEFFNKNEFKIIADLGCGNGDYLSKSIKYFNKSIYFASDVSNEAIKETKKNLSSKHYGKKINYCKSDAFDVKKWATSLNKLSKSKEDKILISMWYIVHEISKNSKERIVSFLKNIKKYCPKAEIVIGEIIKVDNQVLSQNKDISILPEFLFFHEISKQGVLTVNDFKYIKKKMPYKLANKYNFDNVIYKNKKIPSAIIWHLK
jgi:hypothetical protein